jgi:hypothetical protein
VALSFGNFLSAATTAFMTKGRKVTFTPSALAAAAMRSFTFTSSVTSHCSTKVKCAAVRLERAMFSAMRFRTPFSGTRSSGPAATGGAGRAAGAGARRTSSASSGARAGRP